MKEKIKSIIESILFTMGESVEADRLAAALEIPQKDLRQIMEEMMQEYESQGRGVQIIELDDAYQMCTRKESYEYLIKLVKIPRNYKLTDIQLETLSIIAYKQPVTKLEIEKIRGVQSDHAVNRLVEAGLVQEVGRLDQPGKPVIFGTTEEFLRRFGLKNTEDLPDIQVEKVESFKMEAEQELGYTSMPEGAGEDAAAGNVTAEETGEVPGDENEAVAQDGTVEAEDRAE